MGTCFSHRKEKKFSVSLCGDVLLDVLQFGNRRQLLKLERVGRRFHWMVENFYGGRPFLRLYLDINQCWEMEAFIIGSRKRLTKVSLANLTSVPSFIRFNEVKLFYNIGSMSIEKKCRSIGSYLQPLKDALKDSNSIRFYGVNDRNSQAYFSDHSKLLNHLSKQLLKICNSSREYNFSIYFRSEEEAGAEDNVINSIIQMPQIYRCSHLRINLCCAPQPMLLPVEVISSWLNRSIGDGVNLIGCAPQEIFLRIYAARIQNVVEMCDHLAKEFQAAKAPTMSYTFLLGNLSGDAFTFIKKQKFQNKKTNEEFSIHAKGFNGIEIKRMKKKN